MIGLSWLQSMNNGIMGEGVLAAKLEIGYTMMSYPRRGRLRGAMLSLATAKDTRELLRWDTLFVL